MRDFHKFRVPPPQEMEPLPTFLTGYFIISDSELRDPNFYRTVVFILNHDKNGSLGLVINRPSNTTIREITTAEYAGSPFAEHTVYVGGPVDQNYLFALHTGLADNRKSENAIEAVPGIVFEPDFTLLQGCFSETHETRIRFFAGYAGWSAGQLEAELKRSDWIVVKASVGLLFSSESNGVWQAALYRKGGIYSVTAEIGTKPSIN
jgi:putative transcriptional regulator